MVPLFESCHKDSYAPNGRNSVCIIALLCSFQCCDTNSWVLTSKDLRPIKAPTQGELGDPRSPGKWSLMLPAACHLMQTKTFDQVSKQMYINDKCRKFINNKGKQMLDHTSINIKPAWYIKITFT